MTQLTCTGAGRSAGGSGAFTGAYDAIANLVHVYEPARCTLSAYSGNALVRLRRASDDAESDFSHVSAANPELDTAAIAAWAGGAAYIVTIYDQKGSDDITQDTAANQPLYVANAKNGHAGGSFDGSDYVFGEFTFTGALSQPFSVYVCAQLDAASVNDDIIYRLCDGNNALNRMILTKRGATNPDSWNIYAGADVIGGVASSDWLIWSALFNGASSEFWLNAVSNATGNAGLQNANGLTLGAQYNGNSCWKGYIVNLIICDPSHSNAQRGDMQTAINSYWAAY